MVSVAVFIFVASVCGFFFLFSFFLSFSFGVNFDEEGAEKRERMMKKESRKGGEW